MITIKHAHGDYDATIIREVPREYAGVVDRCKGAVVLDIGAHIGCFAVLALNAGAARVIAVEPASPNVKLLRANVKPAGNRATVLAGGVGNGRTLHLRYLGHMGSMAAAKTVTDTRRTHWNGVRYVYEEVKAYRFADLLRTYEPAVLKMDCEGVEYDCLESLYSMPPHVTTFIAEWHKTAGRRINDYLACVRKLRAWGFVPEKEPNLRLKHQGRKIVGSNQFFIRPIAWKR
jgi:FkbM family methyltransferase